MIKVLMASQDQFRRLNDFESGVSKLAFIMDGYGNYIVGKEVLDDPAFLDIHDQLTQLTEIDYVPSNIQQEVGVLELVQIKGKRSKVFILRFLDELFYFIKKRLVKNV